MFFPFQTRLALDWEKSRRFNKVKSTLSIQMKSMTLRPLFSFLSDWMGRRHQWQQVTGQTDSDTFVANVFVVSHSVVICHRDCRLSCRSTDRELFVRLFSCPCREKSGLFFIFHAIFFLCEYFWFLVIVVSPAERLSWLSRPMAGRTQTKSMLRSDMTRLVTQPVDLCYHTGVWMMTVDWLVLFPI